MRLGICLLTILSGITGCSASSTAGGPPLGWIARNGGILHGLDAARAERVADRFSGIFGRPFRTYVLGNQMPTAFAWPSGDVFVTRPLMNVLSDDELAAVIAHELGHLLTDLHLDPNAAITGSPTSDAMELLADDAGLILLSESRTPLHSLRSALQKISNLIELKASRPSGLAPRIGRLP